MLAMWLSLRVQVLKKDIYELGAQRESLTVEVAELRRTVVMRSGFPEIAPRARDRELRPATQDQIVALAGETEDESPRGGLAETMTGALATLSAARARTVPGSVTRGRPKL